MMLSKKKANRIAMQVLEEKIVREPDMMRMVPSEIKKSIKNASKKMDIPKKEIAQFVKLMLKKMQQKNFKELNKIIGSK